MNSFKSWILLLIAECLRLMAKSQFSEDAIKDINAICDYLAKNNPRSASNLFDSIR